MLHLSVMKWDLVGLDGAGLELAVERGQAPIEGLGALAVVIARSLVSEACRVIAAPDAPAATDVNEHRDQGDRRRRHGDQIIGKNPAFHGRGLRNAASTAPMPKAAPRSSAD